MASKNYSHGKRMVREDLIKEIGQGGGGSEYTAGTGISIENDTISVDTETVAMKSDTTNFVEWYEVDDGDTLTPTQIDEIKKGLKRLRYRGWLFELTHDESETNQILHLQCVTLDSLTNYSTPGEVCSYFISVATDTGYVSVNSNTVVKANPTGTPAAMTGISIGGYAYEIKPQLQNNSLELTHGGDEHKKAKIETMTGSTGGVQQTGIKIYGTSDNSSAGTPLDKDMINLRPAKLAVKVPAIEFGTSSSPLSTIDISSGATVKIGTDKVLTEADVVANSGATPTATLTDIQVGNTVYGVSGGASYTAGTGIGINNNTISIDTAVVPRLDRSNKFTNAQAIVLDTTNHGASSPGFDPSIEIAANKGYSSSAYAKLMLNYYKANTKYVAGEISISTDNQLRIVNKNTSNGDASIYIGLSSGQAGRALSISDNFIRFDNGSGNIVTVPEKTGTIAITSDITNTIPECPTTTDGTYVLEATVSSGVVTYAWVLKQ